MSLGEDRAFGRGLSSIRFRFALAVAAMAMLSVMGLMVVDSVGHLAAMPVAWRLSLLSGAALVPAVLTYLLAGRLTRPLEELRRSTEALANGEVSTLADIDCRCEIGGLAESFHRMVARFNSNIVRMNVLAFSDAVTQLPNRVSLNHILRAATRDPDEPFHAAVLFIDLDHFKQINDTLGHEAGDELLRLAVGRMLDSGFNREIESVYSCISPLGGVSNCVPEDVLVARFAGDEFVAVVPGDHDDDALATIAARIINALAEPFEVADTTISIGASIGIARMPVDASDPEGILSCADMAMYAAKRAGRGRHAFFDAELRQLAQDNLAMESEIRAALDRGDVFLEYQAKITCADLSLAGVEALVRLRDRAGKVRMPGEFISVAEKCGLIEQLGNRVLDLAIGQGVAWAREGREIAIAVNVAPVQFERTDFAERLIARVAASGLRPDLLEVEITETMAMKDFASSRERMAKLTGAGIRVAIDDLGTGYSNISQLIQLPYDILKIDRSLIAGIGHNPRFETILSGIFTIAEGLGHTTVAEGIETLAQASAVQKLGCTMMQGFLFGQPMSAEQIGNWLTRRSTPPETGLHDVLTRLSA